MLAGFYTKQEPVPSWGRWSTPTRSGRFKPPREWRVETVSIVAVDQAIQIFNAIEGRYPSDHDEFMEKIIRANAIKLPILPNGGEFKYDETERKLMVVYREIVLAGVESLRHSVTNSRVSSSQFLASQRPGQPGPVRIAPQARYEYDCDVPLACDAG